MNKKNKDLLTFSSNQKSENAFFSWKFDQGRWPDQLLVLVNAAVIKPVSFMEI